MLYCARPWLRTPVDWSERPRLWSILRGSLWNILGATLMLAGVALVAVNAQSVLDFNAVAAHHGGRVTDLGHDATPQAGRADTWCAWWRCPPWWKLRVIRNST